MLPPGLAPQLERERAERAVGRQLQAVEAAVQRGRFSSALAYRYAQYQEISKLTLKRFTLTVIIPVLTVFSVDLS